MEIKITETALKIIVGAITTIALAMISSKGSSDLDELDNTFDN